METVNITRQFYYKAKDKELKDPGQELTTDEVLDFYCIQFPELTNASITGPKITEDKMIFSFETAIKTKG